MQTEILGEGAFQRVRVLLAPGERFVSEAGRMVRMSANVETDVTTRSRGKGGILGGLKRLAGGDSFFLATYQVRGTEPGEVVLAPTHLGECRVIELDGTTRWLTAGGSYIGSGPGVATEPRWQGLKGLVSESVFFLEADGQGPLLVSAFGCLRDVEVAGSLVVDTGHVVAFESSLEYEITKAGSSWVQSFLSGEGLVMRFQGHGRLVTQTHNLSAFGKLLGPKLPPRRG